MNVGKSVENAIIESCKREGIFVDNNVPFRVKMNGIPIAGELDIILRTQPCGGINYLCEVKSIYGYAAQKDIFGTSAWIGKNPGAPRDSYIMQTALYLNHFSRLDKKDPSYLPFGAIFVCDRGDGHFGVFDIWLEKELKITGEDEVFTYHKIYYASTGMDVPKTLVPYTVEDILSSYRVIQNSLERDDPPPRDFVKEYDTKQVEQKYAMKKITPHAYKKWKGSHGPRGKGKEVLGDWNCNRTYCKWSSLCWNDDSP
jgi:hypothetical protein